jgi:hypothetical protein
VRSLARLAYLDRKTLASTFARNPLGRTVRSWRALHVGNLSGHAWRHGTAAAAARVRRSAFRRLGQPGSSRPSLTCPSPKRVRVEFRVNASHDPPHPGTADRGRPGTYLGAPRSPGAGLERTSRCGSSWQPCIERRDAALKARDRFFWIVHARTWQNWRTALIVVQPDIVVRWHRDWLRRRWTRRSLQRSHGRPHIDQQIRTHHPAPRPRRVSPPAQIGETRSGWSSCGSQQSLTSFHEAQPSNAAC